MEMEVDTATAVASLIEDTSTEFLGRWNRLVSTTNWEKGRIICAWREKLLDAGAPLNACTDEAWSKQAGNVSPQHVGRLRRVYQRFGKQTEQYPGLFWSHFFAAMEWPDAEMYLQGAVSNRWSVADMRKQRCEAMGGVDDHSPDVQEIYAAEADEGDAQAESEANGLPETIRGSQGEVHAADEQPTGERTGSAEAGEGDAVADRDRADPPFDVDSSDDSTSPVRPFANLPALPDNLADACEAFKLAILQHKMDGWREVACGEVLQALDALKALALAPPEA